MNRKLIPVILILSSFFLFACGLTSGFFNNEEQADSIQEETVSPIEVGPTPEMEETEVMIDPTETALIPDSQIDTESACYHPFFPIVDGAFWAYQSNFDDGYTLRIDKTSHDTFTMIQEMENGEEIYTVDWYCSDDGLLNGTFAQFDLMDQAEDGEDVDFSFETLEWEGQTLPAPELMTLGYTWTSSYKLSGDANISELTTTLSANVTIEYTIAAIEAVTVPAGTFPEAYRVDSVGVIEMILSLGETTQPFSMTDFTYSTWYVEGVGMVKSSNDASIAQVDIELVASSFTE